MKNAIYWRGFGLGVAVGALFVWILAASALSKNADRENAALPGEADRAARLASSQAELNKYQEFAKTCASNFSASTIVYVPAPARGLNLANGLVSIVPGPALQAAAQNGLQPSFFVPAHVAVRALQAQQTLYYSYVENGSTAISPIQMVPVANPAERFRLGQPFNQ